MGATFPIKVPPDFRIIAHRGASAYAPENTVPAFRLAERMGVTELELDVQLSKDNQIVICHDQKLDRYGYPGQAVNELTYDELLDLDMGSWYSPFLYGGERLLGFDTFLRLFRDRFTYHVEIKSLADGLVPALLEAIRAQRLQDRVIVTSFHLDRLEAVKAIAPHMRTGWLLRPGGFTPENVTRAEKAGCYQICPAAGEVDAKIVAHAHEHVTEVRIHSVRTVTDMLRTIESGCDGLTTNWPDWLVPISEGCKR